MTSPRRQPSKGDRHAGRKGTPVGAAHRGRKSAVVPQVQPGQVRCPICRNSVGVTTRGNLRSHVDLFGILCGNRSDGTRVSAEPPPVVLPQGNHINAQPRGKSEPSRLDAGSNCRECGKWLPGERSLCGRCYARSA